MPVPAFYMRHSGVHPYRIRVSHMCLHGSPAEPERTGWGIDRAGSCGRIWSMRRRFPAPSVRVPSRRMAAHIGWRLVMKQRSSMKATGMTIAADWPMTIVRTVTATVTSIATATANRLRAGVDHIRSHDPVRSVPQSIIKLPEGRRTRAYVTEQRIRRRRTLKCLREQRGTCPPRSASRRTERNGKL